MEKFVNGIYEICNSLQPVAAAVTVLALIIAGITAAISGADGKMKMKEDLKWIIIGCGVACAAFSIGKTITAWFL